MGIWGLGGGWGAQGEGSTWFSHITRSDGVVTWIDQVWWSCDQGWNRIFFQMMNLGKQLCSNSGHEGGKSVHHLRQMLLVMIVGGVLQVRARDCRVRLGGGSDDRGDEGVY